MHGAGRHRALEVTLAGVALAVALAHGLVIPVTGEQRQCDQCVEQTINHRGLPNCRSCPTGIGVPVLLRMHDPLLAAIDAWIAAQGEPLSRPEGALVRSERRRQSLSRRQPRSRRPGIRPPRA